MDFDMYVIGFVSRVAYMALTAMSIFLLLRWFDHLSGLDFKEVINGVEKDPMASAVYLGARFVGVCLAAGLLLS